jgi:hypothetical protein
LSSISSSASQDPISIYFFLFKKHLEVQFIMYKSLSQKRGVFWRYTQLICLATTRTASSFSRIHAIHQRLSPSTSFLSAANVDILSFGSSFESVSKYNTTLVIGKKATLEEMLPDLLQPLEIDVSKPILNTLTKSINAKRGGASTTLVACGDDDDDNVHKLCIGGLPTKLSRNNHPMAVHSLTKLASACKGNTRSK